MSGAPSIAAAGVSPGDVLAGKYRVEQVLGVGGMGVVVAAEHLQLKERVALKFLHPEVVRDEDAVRRFLREAQSAVRIKSEHVARVTDVGTLENGAPYMVMEYLTGTDLAGFLEQRGPLPLGEVTDLLLQACDALAEAHALGIVHRDLKPSNLFLTRRADGSPLVKVLDFGISKNVAPAGESKALTQTSSFIGSPYYMSPEQLRSAKAVDARSDVWSLGVVLFELLTAAHPFEADNLTGLMIAISTEQPIPLSSKRPDIDGRVQSLLSRCLERDLSRRVQNVGEFAALLAPFASVHARHYVERITRTLGASVPPQSNVPVTKTVALEPSRSAPPAAAPAAGVSANLAVNTAGGWAETNKEAVAVPVKASKVPVIAFATLVTFAVVGGVAWKVRSSPDSPSNESTATAAASAVVLAPSAVASVAPPVVPQPPQPVPPSPSAEKPAEAPAAPPIVAPKKNPIPAGVPSAMPAPPTAKKVSPPPPPAAAPPPPAPKKPAPGSAFDTQ